jgi:dienelactone hydrolase
MICHIFWRGSAMRYALLIASIVFSILSAVLPGHAQPPPPAPEADLLVEDVPLPSDVGVSNPQNVPENLRRFSGAWVGAWGGQLRHVLVVENVMADGNADVIYAVGDNPAANVRRQWRRHKATISGNTLQVDPFATYELTSNGRLDATYQARNGRSRARMSRIELGDLMRAGAAIAWGLPNIEFLDTALREDGKPIRLETVLVKPSGPGPFPLAVFNHGSTGNGKDPRLFAQTQWSPDIANFLVDRGWMVAFPQRRGRGKSDGLYDEGFGPDRTRGYTCDPNLSLAGADRALGDIKAAVDVLRKRPDVAPRPIVIGGLSRGGVLSIAYAGKHPQQVDGVINFVGGWVGEHCVNAPYINGSLFEMGGAFPHPTIWLYGNHDSTYGLDHSRANFAAFQKAGGKGSFAEFEPPATANGHFIHTYPQLWSDTLAKYLGTLEAHAP